MVYFGERITLEANARVVRLLRLLEREPIAAVRNVHPGYCSVLVKFDALRCMHADLEVTLRGYLGRLGSVRSAAQRVVEIPVCYGGEFGPDLEELSAAHGLTVAQVVTRHTAATYLAYFLGFVPGFAYLGRVGAGGQSKATATSKAAGLKSSRPALRVQEEPWELAMPRLATPRRKVPAGSVGIAGNQTAVYPFATPGGWRLIGRTPLKMFRAVPVAASILSAGDRVRFVAISVEKFAEMETA
jgi:inhibitor of KinA